MNYIVKSALNACPMGVQKCFQASRNCEYEFMVLFSINYDVNTPSSVGFDFEHYINFT